MISITQESITSAIIIALLITITVFTILSFVKNNKKCKCSNGSTTTPVVKKTKKEIKLDKLNSTKTKLENKLAINKWDYKASKQLGSVINQINKLLNSKK